VTTTEGPGELRWNRVLRRWVVVAPARAARPLDQRAPSPDDDPGSLEGCPFCPGNEDELPAILMETPSETPPGWAFRAVPNRFAAFRDAAGTEPAVPWVRPARGAQEVLIDSPTHLGDLCSMEPNALVRAVEGWAARYAAMCERPGLTRVLLFRNRGPMAGNSLRHPHAQLIGLELDPPGMRARDKAFRELRRESGGACPLCEPEGTEPDFQDRLVRRTPHLSAWVPWAAEAPFEMWIAPRRHTPDFRTSMEEGLGGDLAHLLGWITRRYRDAAGDPDYNLLLHSPGPRDPDPENLHWWIRLRPRVGHFAGLELLSGVVVNPSSPEADAKLLREGDRNSGSPRA
jgi:UDPglucose--hexose-1-phosphate uridylyltransferase